MSDEKKYNPCSDCEYCNGKGGHWDDESIDQWYWCEHCDAAEEHYAHLRKEQQRKRMNRFTIYVRVQQINGRLETINVILIEDFQTCGFRINEIFDGPCAYQLMHNYLLTQGIRASVKHSTLILDPIESLYHENSSRSSETPT